MESNVTIPEIKKEMENCRPGWVLIMLVSAILAWRMPEIIVAVAKVVSN
jgi:hypothetical protein